MTIHESERLGAKLYYSVFKRHLLDPVGQNFNEPHRILEVAFTGESAVSIKTYSLGQHLQRRLKANILTEKNR